MNSTGDLYRNLTGLRGLACLFVVIDHYKWFFKNEFKHLTIPHAGTLGVMIFFTLSGFLLA